MHGNKYKVRKVHQRYVLNSGGLHVLCIYKKSTRVEDVLLVEFMYLVFTKNPPELRMYFWWTSCTLYLQKIHQSWGCTSGGVHVPCIYKKSARVEDVLLVDFMYLVFTKNPPELRMYFWWSSCTLYLQKIRQSWGCTSGGVHVPCIYKKSARVEDVLLVDFMYLVFTKNPPELRMYFWWSLCPLYLHACQVRITVGDSGLCCLLPWRISSAN